MNWLLRIGIGLVVNALALMIAAALFGKFDINAGPFFIAVLLFTVIMLVLKPLATSVSKRYAHGLTALVGLATTWAGLLLTDVISDGVQIEGVFTWVASTVIVWLALMIWDVFDDRVAGELQKRISGSSGSKPVTS